MTTQQEQELNKAVEEVRPVVQLIESGPPVTKDHYGSYLPLIKSQLHALIFIKAGANKMGVLTAMRLNGIQL
jgi:hypothetical protein